MAVLAGTSVAVPPRQEVTMFHRIVVATDFSECAQKAWELAGRIAAAPGSELVLTHVLTEVPLYGEGLFNIETARKVREGARKWAEGALEAWVGKARAEGLTARAALRTGVAHQEIVALARDERADLVVIGTTGRGGLNRALLGSVADRVVRIAPCPVLTVRETA
jgi:nucleotide-binding universal stress UspA family protein